MDFFRSPVCLGAIAIAQALCLTSPASAQSVPKIIDAIDFISEPLVQKIEKPDEQECTPALSPCVRIIGREGQEFYIVKKDRFRHWATNGRRQRFDATIGIDRMLRIGANSERMSAQGIANVQLGQLDKDYWVIPWCQREIAGREVFKASWKTRETIVMRRDQLQQVAISCQ
jgi:hypothetical protein